MRKISYILLLVIFVFKFFKKVKAAKPKLDKGVSKKINISILIIVKK